RRTLAQVPLDEEVLPQRPLEDRLRIIWVDLVGADVGLELVQSRFGGLAVVLFALGPPDERPWRQAPMGSGGGGDAVAGPGPQVLEGDDLAEHGQPPLREGAGEDRVAHLAAHVLGRPGLQLGEALGEAGAGRRTGGAVPGGAAPRPGSAGGAR